MKLQYSLFLVPCSIFILVSCSVSKQISKTANTILLNDTAISKGHIGISIYEPATNTYWYNYNADKYFIPASNTKLFTLYAGMKYLGDSLVAARLQRSRSDITITIYPSGDPTFLQSKRTGRWWMQLPNKKFIPCSYKDYVTASQNEIPERWLRAQERD